MAKKLMSLAAAVFSLAVVAAVIPSESQAEKTSYLQPTGESTLARTCETSQKQYGVGSSVGLDGGCTFDCILELDTTYKGSIEYKNALNHKSVLVDVHAHGMKNRTLSMKKYESPVQPGDKLSLDFELIFPSEDFSDSPGIYLISVTVRDAEDARAFDLEACLEFPVYLNTSSVSSASKIHTSLAILMLIFALVQSIIK